MTQSIVTDVQWKVYIAGVIRTKIVGQIRIVCPYKQPFYHTSFFMDNTDKQIWGETISKDKEQPAYKFTIFKHS